MPYALGVDLGTTYTAAAVWRDGRADTVALADRAHSIPSALFLREDGTMLVGDAAIRRGSADPDRIAREFKRWLGDDAPLLLGDSPFTAQELTGWLLRWVVDKVVEREGEPPAHVVLTCPAAWGDYRRQLMTEVAATAQMTDVGLMPEPVAAAVYYASQRSLQPGALIAVYDLGGGTFDATVVRKTDGGFEIEGTPGGDDTIGGADFDEVVMNHVAASIGARWADADADDGLVRAGLAQVRAHAVAAKEALSFDIEATVPVILPNLSRQVRITRGEFEAAIRIPVLRTVDVLSRTLSTAGVEPADVDAALLVGGSSRIPLVSQLIAAELGVPVAVDAQPKYAVCLGAAVSAASRMLAAGAPVRSPGLPVAASPSPPLSPSRPVPPPPLSRSPSGPPPPPRSPEQPAEPLLDGAELLVPATMATPGAAAVEFVVADIREPVDMLLRPRPDLPRTPPVLLGAEALAVEHTGDMRRGGRAALIAAAAAVLVVVGVIAIAVAVRRGPGAGPDSAPPSQAASTVATRRAAGAPVRLRSQPVPQHPGDVMQAVAPAPGGGLVAVGWSATDGVPRAWRYRSGRWAQVPGPSGRSALRGHMNGVAGVAGGLVAVGWVARRTSTDPAPKERSPAIWTSPDGQDWHPVQVAVTGGRIGELSDVAARPGGGYVVAGTDWSADPQFGDAAVLTSDDGRRWQRVATEGLDGPGPTTLRRLLVGRGGEALAVGTRLSGAGSRSFLWRSPDVRVWSVIGDLDADASAPASAWGLVRLGDGSLLVSGAEVTIAGEPGSLVWIGPPPSLSLRDTSGTGTPYAVAMVGAAVTAVGAQGTGPTSRAVAWTVELP